MGTFKVRYLVAKTMASGAVRYYWQPSAALRARGFAPIRLGTDKAKAIQEAERLNAQIDAAEDRPWQTVPDSVSALARDWTQSEGFKALAPRTRRDYLYALKFIEGWCGEERAGDISRRHCREWHKGLLAAGRGKTFARNLMATLRSLFAYAVDEEWIAVNPASNLRLAMAKSREEVWTPAQVEAFIAAARSLGRPSMALAVRLAYWAAQRPADVLSLSWAKYDGSGVQVRQNKTGALVYIPLPADVCGEIDQAPRSGTVIVVCEETGRPYVRDRKGEPQIDYRFQRAFALIRTKAGLPANLQFRDFRRTALTDAGAGGATDDELRALSGHRTRDMLKVYVRPTKSYSEAAVAKLKSARKRNELEAAGNSVGTELEILDKKRTKSD